MTLVLRGPTVTTNLLAANEDLYSTYGYFDFTLPIDLGPGELLEITFTGGAQLSGDDTPADFEFYPQVWINSVDEGSFLDAPLSASGNSLAVGLLCRHFNGQGGGADWDTISLGNVSTFYWDTDNNSLISFVTQDAAGLGFTGDSYADSATSSGRGPIGWYPLIGEGENNDGTAQIALPDLAGQTITVGFNLFSLVDDDVNPSAGAYGVIQSIVMRHNGVDYPIDLETVQVGWGNGPEYTSFFGALPEDTWQPNPRRFVEAVTPTYNPNHQAATDFFLEDDEGGGGGGGGGSGRKKVMGRIRYGDIFRAY